MRWRSRRTKGKGKTREGSESSNEPSDSLRYELRRPTNGPYDGPKSTSLYAAVHLEEGPAVLLGVESGLENTDEGLTFLGGSQHN